MEMRGGGTGWTWLRGWMTLMLGLKGDSALLAAFSQPAALPCMQVAAHCLNGVHKPPDHVGVAEARSQPKQHIPYHWCNIVAQCPVSGMGLTLPHTTFLACISSSTHAHAAATRLSRRSSSISIREPLMGGGMQIPICHPASHMPAGLRLQSLCICAFLWQGRQARQHTSSLCAIHWQRS